VLSSDPSSDEARLARLTEAIDDLAVAGMSGLPAAQLAERVAQVWALVEGLDPEIARHRTGYTDSNATTLRRNVGRLP
jgi:hypothetical protein